MGGAVLEASVVDGAGLVVADAAPVLRVADLVGLGGTGIGVAGIVDVGDHLLGRKIVDEIRWRSIFQGVGRWGIRERQVGGQRVNGGLVDHWQVGGHVRPRRVRTRVDLRDHGVPAGRAPEGHRQPQE